MVPPLFWEDPLEEGMATHSSILAWRIPWTEEPGGLQSMELQRVGHDWANTQTHRHTQTHTDTHLASTAEIYFLTVLEAESPRSWRSHD